MRQVRAWKLEPATVSGNILIYNYEYTLYMVKNVLIVLLLAGLLGFGACVPLTPTNTTGAAGSGSATGSGGTGKTLEYVDKAYEANIRTVLLYPATGVIQDVVQSPVINIDENIPLVLEFDELLGEYDYYFMRLVHCNRDWQPSSIFDIDIVDGYNEFPINNYELSFNTRTQYIHYRAVVPRVKVPGNYLLVVYRGSNRDDVVLSQRFMAYRDMTDVAPTVGLSTGVIQRRVNQQIEFTVRYDRLEISSPLEQFYVMVRQNQRWDQTLADLRPTMVRESNKELEYRHFDLENNFKAGNEYRFFDLRTLNFNGQNVAKVELQPTYARAWLRRDIDRGAQAYAEYLDINGQFVVNNVETGPDTRHIESDYVFVNFFLAADAPITGDVHVYGALSNWQANADNKMVYDAVNKGYRAELELKQGWYNYTYLVKSNALPEHHFEGSHFETENQYEVFVYYRPIGGRGDLLAGYFNILYNNRRRN